MRVLGIETATSCGGIGIIEDGAEVAECTLRHGGTLSARLFPILEHMLAEARLSLHEIEGIAVSLGPGSFTGLRVGLSAAKGLALALGVPVVGVPTLDALAANLPCTPFIVIPLLDARKGEVYTSLYRGGERFVSYQALSPKGLIDLLPDEDMVFLGDGLSICRGLIEKVRGDNAHFAPPHLWVVRPTTVALLGQQRLAKGDSDDVASLVPIYVRASDAELGRKK